MDDEFRLSFLGKPQRWMRPAQKMVKGKPRRFTDPVAEKHKAMIAKETMLAWRGRGDPWTGPIILTARFVFAIPPSWPKYVQKAAREALVMHVADPDLDQLIKQVMDGMKGIAYVDDNQIAGLHNCSKRYGDPERTEIILKLMPQPERAVTPGQRRLDSKQADMQVQRAQGLIGRSPNSFKTK